MVVKENIRNYNKIPLELVGKNILEIGPGKQPILSSKLKNKVLNNNYIGIDVDPTPGYAITKGDIINIQLEQDFFDTIIMLEVLEHIHLKYWKNVITKLKDSLEEGGWLIISTPHMERLSDFIHSKMSSPYDYHTVFGINKRVMNYYFPNCSFKMVYYLWFREENERFLKCFGRFVKRLAGFGSFPLKRTLMMFWQKRRIED